MELTRNEIIVLVNYYQGICMDAMDRMNQIKEGCKSLIDRDLFDAQMDRYKKQIENADIRLGLLKVELEEF